MSFEKLNLKQFFPNDLINIKNKVLRTWNNIDKYKSDLDLKKIISNVVENISISYPDFSAIIYNIKKIETLIKNENVELDIFLSEINVEGNINDNEIVGLFEDIYEVFITYYNNTSIENQLNLLIKEYLNIVDSNSIKIEIYKKYAISSNTFFHFLFINIKNGLLKNKWEEHLNYYSISKEREIFYDFINEIFTKFIEYIQLRNENVDILLSNLIDKRTYNDKIISFKVILDHYKNVNDVEYFSDTWMKKILKDLGHPDKNPINWIGFKEDEIKIMKKWLIKNQLEEIFTIEVKDKKRLEFWKKYISYIKKVEFYKGLNQAIIMETASHTFIEFGEKGNAFYIYNLENLNIKSIEGIGKINLWKLKNREEALIYLPHSGSWERKFINELYNIGYEIKGKNYGYNR